MGRNPCIAPVIHGSMKLKIHPPHMLGWGNKNPSREIIVFLGLALSIACSGYSKDISSEQNADRIWAELEDSLTEKRMLRRLMRCAFRSMRKEPVFIERVE